MTTSPETLLSESLVEAFRAVRLEVEGLLGRPISIDWSRHKVSSRAVVHTLWPEHKTVGELIAA